MGVLRRGAEVEGAQGYTPDLGPAIGEKRVHAEPDEGSDPGSLGLLEVYQPIPETQKQEGEPRC